MASSSATGRTPRQSRVPTNSQSGSQILIRSTSSPIYDISPTSATSDDSTTTTAEQEELTNEDSDTGSEETAEYGTSTLDGITSDEESMTLSEEETLSGGGGNTVTVIVAGSTTGEVCPRWVRSSSELITLYHSTINSHVHYNILPYRHYLNSYSSPSNCACVYNEL